jgi:general secretion pathway protein H
MPRPEEKVKLPTLVTGISIRKRSLPLNAAPTGDSQRGFTLWELLVVVAIVAITISMMQFSVGLGDQTRDLKRIGKDLGKLFHLLNQEAVFEGHNFAISVQEKGFVVLKYEEGNWTPAEDSFLSRFKMTESQISELVIESQVIDISPKSDPQPHILILSSGEMTPFEWRIRDKLSQFGILLQGNMLGSVLMTGPEPLG